LSIKKIVFDVKILGPDSVIKSGFSSLRDWMLWFGEEGVLRGKFG